MCPAAVESRCYRQNQWRIEDIRVRPVRRAEVGVSLLEEENAWHGFGSANIKPLIAYTEKTLNGPIDARHTPPRILRLMCFTVMGLTRTEQQACAEGSCLRSQDRPGVACTSPYFETQSFLTWKCHVEQQDVSYFLCTEFSYFNFEDVAKQLWRRF